MAVTPRLKDSLLGAAGLARSTGRLLRRTATPAARHAVTFLRSRLATAPPDEPSPSPPGGPAPAPAPAPTAEETRPRTTGRPPSPADVAPRVHPHPPEQRSGGDQPSPKKKPAAKRPKPSAPGAKLPPRKPGTTGD